MKIVTGTFVVIALLISQGAIAAPAETDDDSSCHYEEMCNPGKTCRQVLVCPDSGDDKDSDTQDNG